MAMDDTGPGNNRHYSDLRRLSWAVAESVYAAEGRFIARIESADDPVQEYDNIETEDEIDDIFGLDIGVASTVVALSAAGCIPFSSSNAAAFGGEHQELCPAVTFYARPWMVDLLLGCATEAGIGLIDFDAGTLLAYAVEIRHMRMFAHEVMGRRRAFRALRPRQTKPASEHASATR